MSAKMQVGRNGTSGLLGARRLALILLVSLALVGAGSSGATNVTSTADDGGSNTLRLAIEDANAIAGTSTIQILVGSGQSIELINDPIVVPARPLPIGITQPLIVDAGSSSGLTITRAANTGDSFSLSADTTFKNVATFTNGGITISSGVNLTLEQSTQAGDVQSSLSGNGALVKDGTGTLTLSGTNSWAGGTDVTDGTLKITTGNSLPKSSTGGIADVTVQAGAILAFSNDTAASYSYGGSIDGNGKIIKDGTGTVELSGPTAGVLSDWKGGTEILDGTLKVTGLTSLPQTGTTDVNISGSTGILEFNITNNSTYNGVASGNGQLAKSGNGQLTLGNLNTYKGGTSITAGILTGKWVGGVSTLGSGGVTVDSIGTFDLDTGAGNETFDQRITGAGALTKSGTGELTLSSGSNSYTGGITVEAGSLRGTTSSIPGDITFNGGTMVTFAQSSNGTHSGVISLGGQVRIDSAGATVTLDGANTYSEGTFVDNGTLVSSAKSIPTAGRLGQGACVAGQANPDACVVRANTLLTFSEQSDASWVGKIGGLGNVSKTGAGTLTWTAAQLYTGDTTVSAGTLFFNSTLETAGIHVESGATLGGLGTLNTAALTQVAGTISPGDSTTLGTLTLGGPVTFDSTSSLRVRVDPNGNADQLFVAAGQAVNVNAGAKLVVDVEPGDYSVNPITFTALNSNQRTGNFTFTDDYAFLKVDASQPVGGFVNVSVGLDPAANVANFARTRNERAVGNALVNVFANPNPVGDALQSMTTNQIPNALDELSGVPISSSFTTRVAESQRFSRSVARRVRIYANRESPRRQFQKSPPGSNSQAPEWHRDVSFFQPPAASPPGAMSQVHWNGNGGSGSADGSGWGGWMDGYGVFGSLDSSINASGYDYKVYGGAGAIDYGFEDAFLLGASVGYARTDIDSYKAYSAYSTGNTARGAIYGAYTNPDIGAYATLMLSYAWSEFDERRKVNFVNPSDVAKGNYTGNEYSVYGEIGTKAVQFEDLSLHPFIGLAYAYFDRDAFNESGAGGSIDLAVIDQVYQSLNLSAGTTVDQMFELGSELKLRAEIRARYEYEFLDTNPQLRAEFVGTGQGFTAEGVSTGRSVALVGAALEFIDAGGLSTFLSYDARVNGQFLENTVTLGILVEF